MTFRPMTERRSNPGSHFLHDIVIVTRPGASRVRCASSPSYGFGGSQSADHFDSDSERTSSRPVPAAAADCATHLFFGVLPLILASIGLYGVTAYNAGRRTNEIGVRLALGADRRDVFRLILRGALGLISFGLLLGIPLALAAGRFLGHQLYGINQYDPMILALAILVLGSSALAAALIPAFRASSISPLQALRAD